MTGWQRDELARIDADDELQIAAWRRDATLRRPVPIWAVRAGDGLYVRAAYASIVDGITDDQARSTTLKLVPRP